MKAGPGELELAFSTETIVGWRLWRLERAIDRSSTVTELAQSLLAAEQRGVERPVGKLFEYRLRSLTNQHQWPARRRLESHCTVAAHVRPEASCECGIWAFRSRASAETLLANHAFNASAFALGEVSCWGHVLELERGWRSQYAYPLDLTLIGGTDDMIREIADAYGVRTVATSWAEYF